MSRRSINFTDYEVFFECSHGTRRREAYQPQKSNICSSSNDPSSSIGHSTDAWRIKQTTFHAYEFAVNDLTSRSFTFECDRLDAVAGVFHAQYAPRYSTAQQTLFSLLPPQYFPAALPWRASTEDGPLDNGFNRIGTDTRKSRVLPTWSWAGWKGPVRFLHHDGSTNQMSDVLDAANIVCNLRDEPIPSRLILTEKTAPLRCALHLYTECTPFKLLDPSLADFAHQPTFIGGLENIVLEFPGGQSAGDFVGEQAIGRMSSDGYLDAAPSMNAATKHWLAKVFERLHHHGRRIGDSYHAGGWLIPEGEEMSTKRIGIVHLKLEDERLALRYAEERYLRIS